MARPLKTTIYLDHIKHNYLLAKSLHPKAKAFAVVKADAYGHGAVAVAKALDETVDAFAVAAIEEAQELRRNAVVSPILLLEGVFESSEWVDCEVSGYWCAIENEVQLGSFLKSGAAIGKIFVKVDTGMHRLGISPELATSYVEKLKASGKVGEVLLMTHFACSDELSSAVTQEQLSVFKTVTERNQGVNVSVANSAAILKHEIPEGGWIRPGIMLYGISPFADIGSVQLGLKPAMSFATKVISLRTIEAGKKVGYAHSYVAQSEEKIATLAVGYGDGYPRHAQNGTPVLVDGVRCALAGRVSMDMVTVNVSHLETVKIGSDVELWGRQLPVEEVAHHATTIGYELVTRMTSRSAKIYR